ncbi:MAG TPA: tRNA lysidine(34) synthetase TilS [Verrucomicrobiae bacterium]|nr:tRNA lysidine(34) synthetase TilS [Verrucomicrobiae bacterium]
MIEKAQKYISEQRLLQPGDRVAVAVSGGADSVALLRALLELRSALGIVLSVTHFNHRIRGQEADADEQFTRELSGQFDLDFHAGSANVPAYAREHKVSLETAARELRHAWFARLISEGHTNKIATAHTLDDQAETVLMRVVRGAGTRGLAGISPWQREKRLIRPLLSVTRKEIESYLTALGQTWREDSSNRDLAHTRNRVRHELLPLLEQDYNPGIRQPLADLAEVARAEEDYWNLEIKALFTRLVREGKPRRGPNQTESAALAVDISALRALPLAVQRRLLRAMGEWFGAAFDFQHVRRLLALGNSKETKASVKLPCGLAASRSYRELRLSRDRGPSPAAYSYTLPVPGEVQVPELGTVVKAHVIRPESGRSGYNSALLLDRTLLAPELTVRNWRAGDRFFPAHTKSPKRVKALLQAARLGRHVSPAERKAWPVVESAGELVWMRGFPAPVAFTTESGLAVLIEEVILG